MARGEARDEGFELAPPLGPRQAAQVLPVDGEQIIDADEGRIVGEHPFRHRLAPEPLLERVEAGGAARRPALRLAANKQFAVDHRILIEGGEQFGKGARSEEHTSELQSLMRISYAVFCLKKKNTQKN